MWLLDLVNPLTWWGHLRGARQLQIAEEQLVAGRAAKLGARYETGEPPRLRQSSLKGLRQIEIGEFTHVFRVYCAGPSYADAVTVWLAYGRGLTLRTTNQQLVGLLRPNDPPERVELIESDLFGKFTRPQQGALMCRWTDGNGTHIEPLLEVTVHPKLRLPLRPKAGPGR